MNTRTHDEAINEKWENGEYGRSDEHVVVASDAIHEAFNQGMAMKLVSIRLPATLIETLKMIAEHHGIAYQPMVRDLLTRFARSELQQIVADLDAKMRDAQSSDESSPPVQAFIERERMSACG
ncbi:hypothetical protein ABB30_10180 [Stenotrophomonas ginsengisoli]|uniref:Uncharacterized protein n=1 Tax=Stenotrophomonas ginsengisoli TaxID=336566 RepID=A0A0R0D422_9GAMM|nr:CopG family antitoxin [Stenotrophomonas ginsengisoli]KRG76176.1 hypothetical protein ABB30_10180 [Stenotrophomonas ginsengisoli]